MKECTAEVQGMGREGKGRERRQGRGQEAQ